MDVIVQIRLFWLAGFVILYGVALGTVLLLSGWRERRAQRCASLCGSRQSMTVPGDVATHSV